MAASVTQTLPLPGLPSVAPVNSPEGLPAQPIITVQPEPTTVMESNGGITATGSGAEYCKPTVHAALSLSSALLTISFAFPRSLLQPF
jgi:hypothetical protein